jgi:hypothetical protein
MPRWRASSRSRCRCDWISTVTAPVDEVALDVPLWPVVLPGVALPDVPVVPVPEALLLDAGLLPSACCTRSAIASKCCWKVSPEADVTPDCELLVPVVVPLWPLAEPAVPVVPLIPDVLDPLVPDVED